MAEMKIITQKIERIEPHDNADRLEVAFTDTFDWPVIIGKGSFKVGDEVIHFPIDCIIPPELEEILLGGSKMKLSKGRVRAAKIRGIVSYGIIAPLSKLKQILSLPEDSKDLMGILGCKKYEPPVKSLSPKTNIQQRSKKTLNTNFDKYFNMNHLQNCKGIFNDDDIVIVTEKLHGTSFRAGWVKRDVTGWWCKLKHFFNLSPDKDWEFVYGSRNVQLQDKLNRKGGYYSEDVYTKMVNKYDLKDRLPKGIVIYAEIVGPGIQKNYQYTEDHEMFIYDIKKNGEYIGTQERFKFSPLLNKVPVLIHGEKFGILKDKIQSIFEQGSTFDLGKFPIEGIVIETPNNEICRFGRKKVKVINSEYLLNKTNTDFH